MIGDNPETDIEGARAAIDAVTLQKRHKGVEVRDGADGPDLVFDNFSELRRLFSDLLAQE